MGRISSYCKEGCISDDVSIATSIEAKGNKAGGKRGLAASFHGCTCMHHARCVSMLLHQALAFTDGTFWLLH